MKKLTLTDKDLERGRKYVAGLTTSKELDEYVECLLAQGYEEHDLNKMIAVVDERKAQVSLRDESDRVIEMERRASYVYDLSKLQPYLATPRNTASDFFRDVAGRPPIFGKSNWLTKFENAPIVYAAVVQANNELWDPGQGTMMPAVFVFSLDSSKIHDTEWLKKIATQIMDLKNGAIVPSDSKNLINALRDDQSIFCFKVGKSITGNIEAWCCTKSIEKQADLPNGCLSSDKIVPFMLHGEIKENYSPNLIQIPGKYYK
ncbi:MAG: hypothetical protein ACRDA4_01040 [Filifactoraceae bacterium]